MTPAASPQLACLKESASTHRPPVRSMQTRISRRPTCGRNSRARAAAQKTTRVGAGKASEGLRLYRSNRSLSLRGREGGQRGNKRAGDRARQPVAVYGNGPADPAYHPALAPGRIELPGSVMRGVPRRAGAGTDALGGSRAPRARTTPSLPLEITRLLASSRAGAARRRAWSSEQANTSIVCELAHARCENRTARVTRSKRRGCSGCRGARTSARVW